MLRHALENFANNVLSDRDSCTLCTFDSNLIYKQILQRNRDLDFSSIGVSSDAGTRLYDSICDVICNLCTYGNTSHDWIIIIITYNNDDVSTCTADECKRYILTRYASGMQNRYIFLVSVGNNVDCDQLDALGIDKCLYHIHVKRSSNLETDLIMKICYSKTVSENTSGIDFVICINNCASAAPSAASSAPSAASSAVLNTVPSQLELADTAMSQLSIAAALPLPEVASATVPTTATPATATPATATLSVAIPATAITIPAILPATATPATAIAIPATLPATPAFVSPPSPATPAQKPVQVKMRVFSSKYLHHNDIDIFAKFARANGMPIDLEVEDEDEMIFLIVIDSNTKRIVGLLMLILYDPNKAHIGVIVVEPSYRKHGIATNMLKYVANKYTHRTVTLSITFNRLDLLDFYYNKGYFKFDKFVTKHKIIVFVLVHEKLNRLG